MAGNAVALRLKGQLERWRPAIERVSNDPRVADRLLKLALIAGTTDNKLAKCSPSSIALAVLRAAQLGLDLGTQAHIVNYGDKAVLNIDFRGFVSLMSRSGVVRVEARCVYRDEMEAGDFDVEYGTNPHIYHKPNLLVSRINDGIHERAVLAYCVAFMQDGSCKFEVMREEELEAARNGKGGPWVNMWRPEMEKKTVLRRLAKTIPQTPELAAALELESRSEGWAPARNSILDAGEEEIQEAELVKEDAE